MIIIIIIIKQIKELIEKLHNLIRWNIEILVIYFRGMMVFHTPYKFTSLLNKSFLKASESNFIL